jgi:hypothetical protein
VKVLELLSKQVPPILPDEQSVNEAAENGHVGVQEWLRKREQEQEQDQMEGIVSESGQIQKEGGKREHGDDSQGEGSSEKRRRLNE